MVDPLSILSSLDSLFAAARSEVQETSRLDDDLPHLSSADNDPFDDTDTPIPYDDLDSDEE